MAFRKPVFAEAFDLGERRLCEFRRVAVADHAIDELGFQRSDGADTFERSHRAPQLIRLAEALKAAGPGADIVVRRFLQAMINAEERPKVSSIMSSSPVPDSDGNAEVS